MLEIPSKSAGLVYTYKVSVFILVQSHISLFIYVFTYLRTKKIKKIILKYNAVILG